IAELSKGGSGIVAKRSVAAKRSSASPNETSVGGNGATADRIFARASSSLITRRPFNQQSTISNLHLPYWQSVITRHILARPILVRWLSGRKQRFAKAPYPKRVPTVRIPPSPRSRDHSERRRGISNENI